MALKLNVVFLGTTSYLWNLKNVGGGWGRWVGAGGLVTCNELLSKPERVTKFLLAS